MVDIGLVGEVEAVNPEPIRLPRGARLHPGDRAGRRGRAAARPTTSTPTWWPGDVAAALGAEKLIHLTDVQGIKGGDGAPHLDPHQAGGASA